MTAPVDLGSLWLTRFRELGEAIAGPDGKVTLWLGSHRAEWDEALCIPKVDIRVSTKIRPVTLSFKYSVEDNQLLVFAFSVIRNAQHNNQQMRVLQVMNTNFPEERPHYDHFDGHELMLFDDEWRQLAEGVRAFVRRHATAQDWEHYHQHTRPIFSKLAQELEAIHKRVGRFRAAARQRVLF